MSEKEEQKKVCDYLDFIGLFYYAIPAVSFTKKQGGYPIGYKKGMPDLCIPALNLYLEMKAVKPGKVKEHEENQKEIHDLLRLNNQTVERCEGAGRAIELIEKIRSRLND